MVVGVGVVRGWAMALGRRWLASVTVRQQMPPPPHAVVLALLLLVCKHVTYMYTCIWWLLLIVVLHCFPGPNRYELCTHFGLYVVDEANVETHGFDPTFQHDASHPAHQPEWAGALLERVTRMFGRDRNAACIILWSLGNEAGYGAAHDAMAAWLRRQDPTRPVHYEVCPVLASAWLCGWASLHPCTSCAAFADVA